jgi:hypothetical protein
MLDEEGAMFFDPAVDGDLGALFEKSLLVRRGSLAWAATISSELQVGTGTVLDVQPLPRTSSVSWLRKNSSSLVQFAPETLVEYRNESLSKF